MEFDSVSAALTLTEKGAKRSDVERFLALVQEEKNKKLSESQTQELLRLKGRMYGILTDQHQDARRKSQLS